jgi:hypothetical protein
MERPPRRSRAARGLTFSAMTAVAALERGLAIRHLSPGLCVREVEADDADSAHRQRPGEGRESRGVHVPACAVPEHQISAAMRGMVPRAGDRPVIPRKANAFDTARACTPVRHKPSPPLK